MKNLLFSFIFSISASLGLTQFFGTCTNPITATCGDTTYVENSNLYYDNNFNTYNCAFFAKQGPEVILEYVAPASGNIVASIISVSPSNKDMHVSIMSSCSNSGCLNMSPANGTTDSVYVTAGNTYYIVVDGADSDDEGVTTGVYISCPAGIQNNGLNCNTAINISCGQTVSGTTAGGQNNISTYGGCGTGQDESGPEKIYKLITNQTEDITATLTSVQSGQDLDIHILNACDSNACVARGDVFATYSNAAPGTYYIVVDGYQGDVGTFTLNVDCSSEPAGTCGDPIPVACGTIINGNTGGKADNLTDYNCYFTDKDAGELVYEYVPVSSGKIAVNLLSFDPGKSFNLSVLSACDATFCIRKSSTNSSITDSVSVVAGNKYYIVMDGEGVSDTGAFSFQISCPQSTAPSGNICANATTIECGQTVSGTTVGLSNNIVVYDACSNGQIESGPEKVYVITTLATGDLTASLSNLGSNDLDIHILDACDSNNCVARDDNSATYNDAPPGTYYIVVDGYQGAQGTFDLTVTCENPEDGTCSAPFKVTCGIQINGNNAGYSNDFEDYNCAFFDKEGPDVVYRYVPLRSGKITAKLLAVPNGKEMVVSIATQCTVNDCLDMSPTNGTTDSILVQAGYIYYVIVDGANVDDTGNYTIQISCPVGEDDFVDCANAITANCGQNITGSNAGKPNNINFYPCGSSFAKEGGEVVYKYIPSQSGKITAKLNSWPSGKQMQIGVFSTCDMSSCIELSPINASTDSIDVISGNTYYIVVDGTDSDDQGTFSFNISCPVAGNNTNNAGTCADPIPLTCGIPYSGTTTDGLANYNGYSCGTQNEFGKEKIHIFTISDTSVVTASLSGLGGEDLDVHILNSCNPGDCIARADNTASATLNPGTYYISVDGFGSNTNNEGAYTLSLSCTPTTTSGTGNCGNPISISCGVPFNGTTTDGQAVFNNYGCAPQNEFGKEKIHQLVLTDTSNITATLSNLNGVDLDVHILSACNASACIARNDNSATANDLLPGTYYIVVDGFGNNASQQGSYTLLVNCTPTVSGSTNGTCSNPIAISCGVPYNGTTVDGQSNFNGYISCAPQNEFGREKIHEISITDTSNLTATLSNLNGVDLDVHILAACNTSACIARGDISALATDLLPGNYYIVVDGYGSNSSQQGTYTLNVTCTPTGNNNGGGNPLGTCGNPIALSCGVPYNGTTVDGQTNFNNYLCSFWSEYGKEKVHTITITQSSDLDIQISGLGNVDLDLFLLNACDTSNCLNYGDNDIQETNLPPGTYYIVVDGYGSTAVQEGTYSLLVNCTPNVDPNACTELFFSEYIEGAAQDKSLEIFNPTTSAVALAGYVVEIYSNGSVTPTSSIALTGTVASQDVFVLSNTSASAAILAETDQTDGGLTHNGNDAIVLLNPNGDTIDIIGQVGIDPGNSWSGGSASTEGQILVRKASVQSGIFNSPATFDPSVEWDDYLLSDLSHLGNHVGSCSVCATASLSASICPNGSYVFGGSTLTAPGTYYDTVVTSNGCDSVTTLVLTQNPYNTLTIYDSACTGDSLLFRGVYYTTPGTYMDTATGVNTCDTVITFNFATTSGTLTPTVTISTSTTTVCDSSTVSFTSLFTNGGNAPTYQWYVNSTPAATSSNFVASAGQLNDGDTVYCVATSSLSCAAPLSATSNKLIITTGSSTLVNILDTICQGETYAFNNQTLTTAGTHYDTVLNTAGCDSVIKLDLHVLPTPQTQASSDVDTVSFGGTVNFTSTGSNGDSLYWDFGDGNTSTLTNVSHTYNTAGTFQVILQGTFNTGCESADTLTIHVLNNAAIFETNKNEWIHVYPNPVTDVLNIIYKGNEDAIELIQVFDIKGNLVKNINAGSTTNMLINVSDLETGMYIIRVTGNNINQNVRIQKTN